MPIPSSASFFAGLILAFTFVATPVQAVIILDSTWAEEGGAAGQEAEGFGAHIALGREPQFAAVVGFFREDDFYGSGTWIGNDEAGHAYVLTVAHNFGSEDDFASWTYVTSTGAKLGGIRVKLHPTYDFAIVTLDGPIEDVGDAPWLYGGDAEAGMTGTIVGYGSRGIGSVGQDDAYYKSGDPAAARNVIDEVSDESGDNELLIDFDREDGGKNVFRNGDAFPVDPFEGILGSGDSGGSLWIKTRQGWAIAGANAWGDDAVYGSTSGFVRVSTLREWILGVFPGAWFTDQED
jgi:hypothetical protein